MFHGAMVSALHQQQQDEKYCKPTKKRILVIEALPIHPNLAQPQQVGLQQQKIHLARQRVRCAPCTAVSKELFRFGAVRSDKRVVVLGCVHFARIRAFQEQPRKPMLRLGISLGAIDGTSSA